MICNSVFVAPWTVFPVGTGGTGGTRRDSARPSGTAAWDRWDWLWPGSLPVKIFLHGSTGPTHRSHQNQQNSLQYHRFHLVHPEARLFSPKTENISVATDEHPMKPLSWASISEQLRAIGVEVPATAPQGKRACRAHRSRYRPRTVDVPPAAAIARG